MEWTERRIQICEFIIQFVAEHGYAPSVREIGRATGMASTSAVQYQILALERAGVLRRQPWLSRSIVLTPGFSPTKAQQTSRAKSSAPGERRHAK